MIILPGSMDAQVDQTPRFLAFSKIENLIQEMQHKDSGVPVRAQKNFLTTIPCAFTGYDLVEWLMVRLQLSDPNEALHLATLLCQCGYYFPVSETKSLAVRDDGTLFRFQSPYFWPSQNWEPNNVDYAIYLTKRAMRNKQRHGLEEHEQSSLNKLQKMLCDKWDFVYMQAEEQVRLSKDRKKTDKVVLDSQEKAFWRVQRPGPGQFNCLLEEGVKRNFRPSQMNQRRRKTVELCKKQIQFLTISMKRPRMKLSKTVDCQLHRFEQYEEHDPFLGCAQPSNPWVTDDTTMWVLNTVLVDTPTEKRVKRWSFDMMELLNDPRGLHEFKGFLEKEYSSENIHFWLAVEHLKHGTQSAVKETVEHIYKEYLAPGAPCEINIDSKTMEGTLQSIKHATRYSFDAAQEHIFLLMKKDSYQRFLRSEQYKHLLATAINPSPKKKFFAFGSKKKSPAPSPSPRSKRRGSAGGPMQNEKLATNSLSQHSYSTGNLQDLDCTHNDKSNKSSPMGSSGDVKDNHSSGRLSPMSLRKKLDDLVHSGSRSPSARSVRSNLEVPLQQYDIHSSTSNSDDNHRNSVNIEVPPRNVVAPWEEEDEDAND